ncbi:MAG TPA: hypothetical protein VL327_03595 [Pyrinomonadaceae bacterium]|jgi:hypothetical protein|nr:hypothetical protein [Pyrinomonadaceae bacterium]
MVNRNNTNVTGEIDKLNENDALAVLSPELLTSRKLQSKENPLNDELIGSLSDAYENKRARQVTEWERRQRVQRAA